MNTYLIDYPLIALAHSNEIQKQNFVAYRANNLLFFIYYCYEYFDASNRYPLRFSKPRLKFIMIYNSTITTVNVKK